MEHSKNKDVNNAKFCTHHQDYRHTIEECGGFKYQVEMELRKVSLTWYVKGKAHAVNAVSAPIWHIEFTYSEVEEVSNKKHKKNREIKKKWINAEIDKFVFNNAKGLNIETWEDILLT